MTTYARYTVASTFRICFTFGLLTVIYDWYFPTILIVVMAVFNDGAMIALSKDRVTPSRVPNRWNLSSIFISGAVYGLYLTCVGLLFVVVVVVVVVFFFFLCCLFISYLSIYLFIRSFIFVYSHARLTRRPPLSTTRRSLSSWVFYWLCTKNDFFNSKLGWVSLEDDQAVLEEWCLDTPHGLQQAVTVSGMPLNSTSLITDVAVYFKQNLTSFYYTTGRGSQAVDMVVTALEQCVTEQKYIRGAMLRAALYLQVRRRAGARVGVGARPKAPVPRRETQTVHSF